MCGQCSAQRGGSPQAAKGTKQDLLPPSRSMLPDVVDAFQQQHEHSQGLETIFYSSYVFFTKLAGACALGISTLSLE